MPPNAKADSSIATEMAATACEEVERLGLHVAVPTCGPTRCAVLGAMSSDAGQDLQCLDLIVQIVSPENSFLNKCVGHSFELKTSSLRVYNTHAM